MYVTGVSYEYKNDGRVYADVTYKGIRRGKGYKQSARAYSNKYTSENAFAGQPTAGLPTEISSPNLAVTSQYVITGTPDMTQVGKNRTPPDPPTPPTNPFIAVENATFAFPFGWVLENRSFERLANTDIYFMTDEYVYYFAYHP